MHSHLPCWNLCVPFITPFQMNEFILVTSITQLFVLTSHTASAPSNFLIMSLFFTDPHSKHDIPFTI